MTNENKKELTEEDILKFWKENKIYEKSKKQNSNGKKFYMMDGPPYATGHIHMGTALNKTLKDIALRSKRLQGFDCFDRAGYDTHGVPIEFQVEKEIGSKSKQDIEKFGVKKFIEKCKKYATQHIDVMGEEFKNLGVWMDFDNPYLTLSDKYIETIWDTFKIANEKGLLYLGQYPVHACPRCETAVAFNEIEYKKQEDTSVFVKFQLKEKKDTSLIIWTTTPWTLPSNTGIMVNPKFTYQEIELSSGEKWIIEKSLIPKIMNELEMGFNVKKEYLGKEMKDWKYENPLSKNLKLNLKNAYKVVLSARYVTNEEGTGLVHTAPGHGKEDFEVGKENNLDMPCPVGLNGILTEEAGKYSGKKAREVDKEIIEDLKQNNALVYEKKFTHDYPICWRCKSPLLMVSIPQWFLKISEIQKDILKENKKTNWIPKWMELRMNAWLEGISDWPISRKRYWGTPLPIWQCDKCEEKIVVGGIKELEKLSKQTVKEIHKPEIDKITIPCKCGNKMKRVEEVLDVWFDAGVSSWAAIDSEKELKKFWPADLNIEGKDQVRGWWNAEFILSQIKFNRKPFETILEHGMILDISKRKMSKSLGNATTPKEIIDKYSRDYMRYYFAKTSKGEDFSFNENDFKEVQSVFRVLLNINNFIKQTTKTKRKENIEDKWILSKYHSFLKKIQENYNSYKFPEVIKEVEQFIIEDFSKTYIKMIRGRVGETYNILNEIRIGLLKILAPIIPFITEKIWQDLRELKIVSEKSIHLSNWPKPNNNKINSSLETEMDFVLKAIEAGLAERDKIRIGLKQPLSKITFYSKVKIPLEKMEEIILSQLNIKNIEIETARNATDFELEFDTKLTPELEAEGFVRELTRKIQQARKEAGLSKEDLIELELNSELNSIFQEQKNQIKEKVNAKKIIFKQTNNEYDYSREDKIKNSNLVIKLRKL
jgi:isoleucyl-tRNA synthetase